jgi:hypothetical protein
LHGQRPADDPSDQLVAIFIGLITEATAAGVVRGDVPPAELAAYCLSALEAARAAAGQAALGRLVDIVWAGLASMINYG